MKLLDLHNYLKYRDQIKYNKINTYLHRSIYRSLNIYISEVVLFNYNN